MLRVALVTTPPSARSGIGDYTRRLFEALGPRLSLRVFVEDGREGEPFVDGVLTESALGIFPREHDQVLFQLGNERQHAFMLPLIRLIGGVVCLHDWVLFDLAVAADPELAKGGLRGHLAALKAGGAAQLAIYRANWQDRRRARVTPVVAQTSGGDALRDAVLVSGWHAPEPVGAEPGRWTADRALLRLPSTGCRRMQLCVLGPAGTSVIVGSAQRTAAHAFDGGSECQLELSLDGADHPSVMVETDGLRVSPEQRAAGDSRRLGTFVRSVRYEDDSGWHELDLAAPSAEPIEAVDLSRDRFRLPLNRSVVRWADAFFVHSEFVGHRILEDRNAPTPIIVVPHGTQSLWGAGRDGARRAARERLGLPADWTEACMFVSFGAVQAHKRIDVLLEGFALALEDRPKLRLALVGDHQPGGFDVHRAIAHHGLDGAVHLAGYVDERRGHDFLHAADLAVQLRGPSTGGSSGGVHQAFSLGRGVIVSDLDEQSELPDGCTRKLAPGPGEAGRLARLMVELADDPGARAAMEAEARRYVEEESSFEKAAERYLEALERFPRPRGHKRRMWAQRVRRARQ